MICPSRRLPYLFVQAEATSQLPDERPEAFKNGARQEPKAGLPEPPGHQRELQELRRCRPADLLEERADVVPAEPGADYQTADDLAGRGGTKGNGTDRPPWLHAQVDLVCVRHQGGTCLQRPKLRLVRREEVLGETVPAPVAPVTPNASGLSLADAP